MKFREASSLDNHLYNLGNAILGTLYPDDNIVESSDNIAVDWLQTAAAIRNVEVNLFTFDPNPAGFCEGADDLLESHSKTLQSHVLFTTKFLYAWSALEAVFKFIKPPKNSSGEDRFDKEIYDSCEFINKYFSNHKPLHLYRLMFEHYLEHLKRSEAYLNVYNNIGSKSIYGIDATGLYLVYLTRNLYAHGDAKFPERSPNNEFEVTNDLKIIRLSTRIILFSIQMLFLAKYESENIKITHIRPDSTRTRIVPLSYVFRTVQYKREQNISAI